MPEALLIAEKPDLMRQIEAVYPAGHQDQKQRRPSYRNRCEAGMMPEKT